MSVISCKQLSHRFFQAGKENVILESINFDVNAGESCAIIGKSGSGKTTLLNLLGLLDTPSQGSIYLCGQNTQKLYKNDSTLSLFRNKNIGFIFQFHHLLYEFTVLENVMMPFMIQNLKTKEFREKKEWGIHLLEKMGMIDKINASVLHLSGGEQQRVAVARALVHKPLIVLADEPTGNLDTELAMTVFKEILDITHSYNGSAVIVTHDPELARQTTTTHQLSQHQLLRL